MNNWIIDRTFILLVQSVNKEEQKKIYNHIVRTGFVPEITVWKQYIVDGFNYFIICTYHHLPYTIKEVNLHNRLHAMKWICEKQLSRKDLTKNFEWYLIGKQFIFEQAACVARYSEENYNKYEDKRFSISHDTVVRLSKQYGISRTSVLKYSDYAKGIDIMRKRDPEMAELALSGKIDISQNNMILLGNLSNSVYKTVRERIIKTEGEYLRYDFPSEYGKKKDKKPKNKNEPLPISVKDMPVFDPNAKLSTLIFTIPKWGNTIERAVSDTDFDLVTPEIKKKLINILNDFLETTEILVEYIKE